MPTLLFLFRCHYDCFYHLLYGYDYDYDYYDFLCVDRYLTAKLICDTLLLRVVPPSLFAAITYLVIDLRAGPQFAFTFAQLLGA